MVAFAFFGGDGELGDEAVENGGDSAVDLVEDVFEPDSEAGEGGVVFALGVFDVFETVFGEPEEDEGGEGDHGGHEEADLAEEIPDDKNTNSAQGVAESSADLDHDAVFPARIMVHEAANEDGKVDSSLEVDGHTNGDVRPVDG